MTMDLVKFIGIVIVLLWSVKIFFIDDEIMCQNRSIAGILAGIALLT